MKKSVGLLICIVLLFSFAAAEQAVVLPGSRYAVSLPDGMKYSAPEEADEGVHAYISDTLEMDCMSYSREEATESGLQPTLLETAEMLAENDEEAELREVNGIEMLVFRVTDDADGAPGIVYVFEDGDLIVEVIFWCATQDAAETSQIIMESIRVTE